MPPDLVTFVERAMALLAPDEAGDLALEPLAGDGSTRSIYRARRGGLRAVAVRNPLPAGRAHPDENEGFLAVREFLDRHGVRVPAFYVADLEQGLLLLEDLGDERLYDRVRRLGWSDPGPLRGYERAIGLLIEMQRPAAPAFDPSIAPNPAYTEAFVLATEARYFHDELARGFAGVAADFATIEPECRRLGTEALSGTARAFMHRDYQSRNLMVCGGGLAVIDFQGARLGPPEYDLAALLYDPYVAMPAPIREDLIRRYLTEAAAARVPGAPSMPDEAWRRRFLANAADRLMQALGAFAKLGGRLGRPGFLEHIPQGLSALGDVLQELGGFPALAGLVGDLARRR